MVKRISVVLGVIASLVIMLILISIIKSPVESISKLNGFNIYRASDLSTEIKFKINKGARDRVDYRISVNKSTIPIKIKGKDKVLSNMGDFVAVIYLEKTNKGETLEANLNEINTNLKLNEQYVKGILVEEESNNTLVVYIGCYTRPNISTNEDGGYLNLKLE
ncbi:MAG: hypothetical protein RR840_08065 [Clostridium sp.]